MNFFNLFKKDPWKKIFGEMNAAILPRGEDDIQAGTNELVDILNNTIDEENIRTPFKNVYTFCTLSVTPSTLLTVHLSFS